MNLTFAYDHRTQVVHDLEWTLLDYAANTRRPAVSFSGRVHEPLLWRQLMSALHRVITSDARQPVTRDWILDPVITVHPDQIFFEAFSTDQSVYARLAAPLSAFDVEETPVYGTTNIDFTWRLRAALQQLRSSRPTTFTVGARGFGVSTQVGDLESSHFERKVEVPDSWLKGFLQVQSAFALKPFRFQVRPVDLLTLLAHLEENKPPHPPTALRYEFRPAEPIQVVAEPWEEETFTFHGPLYQGYDRTVRVWGRRRLDLLSGVLPYAQRVTLGVLGRGLPHFYTCHCGDFTFTLFLSGWSGNEWSRDSAFAGLVPEAELRPDAVERIYHYLSQHLAATAEQIATYTDIAGAELETALFQLCRAGRVIYDLVGEQYRLRELFDEPLDVDRYFGPDPRRERAEQLMAAGRVTLHHVGRQQTRPETKATATVADGEEQYQVIASVDDNGRLRFGRCQCDFFDVHLMSRGPCEHILAARLAMEDNQERPG